MLSAARRACQHFFNFSGFFVGCRSAYFSAQIHVAVLPPQGFWIESDAGAANRTPNSGSFRASGAALEIPEAPIPVTCTPRWNVLLSTQRWQRFGLCRLTHFCAFCYLLTSVRSGVAFSDGANPPPARTARRATATNSHLPTDY